MRFRELILILALFGAPAAARAEITILPDAERWVEAAVKELASGKVDEFSRTYAQMIDQPNQQQVLAQRLSVIRQLGQPVFLERVFDKRYGTALREMIFVALYRRTDYAYFKFVIKKNRGGFVVSSFDFRIEGGELFPKTFLPQD